MSKLSSSASNTTASTLSPAEISELEGLEHVDIHRFTGIAQMQKAIDLQSDRLQDGVSNQQYLVFRPVTEVDLAKMDRISKHVRMTHYKDTSLLVVKLKPSEIHQSAGLMLGMKLIHELYSMGMSDPDLWPLGGTRFDCHMSSKEGDSCYKPSSRTKRTDWPTIVFEYGESESLERLRYDARWWLENSEGNVNIAIVISIQVAEKRLRVEKWERPLRDERRPITRSHPGQIPTKVQEITVLPNDSVAGAPLVLEFEKIFLRPAIAPEKDIIFTAQNLSRWAAAFWQGVQ